MNTITLRALVYADARSLWRDPLLGWVLGLPLGVALLLRALLPRVQTALLTRIGFDLDPYHALIMGAYLMTAPGIVAMVIGFLLVDERDCRTLTALRVTPLSMRHYLAYRIVLPLLLGTTATVIGYPLVGVAPMPYSWLWPLALVGALTAPLQALAVAVAAPNKVAGFAVVKVMNAVSLVPAIAFFIPPPLQFVAGILPTYWPMRALWSAVSGESFVHYLVLGVATSVVTVIMAAALFDRRLLRGG
jgi:fluoroquinolone transport system permease protein